MKALFRSKISRVFPLFAEFSWFFKLPSLLSSSVGTRHKDSEVPARSYFSNVKDNVPGSELMKWLVGLTNCSQYVGSCVVTDLFHHPHSSFEDYDAPLISVVSITRNTHMSEKLPRNWTATNVCVQDDNYLAKEVIGLTLGYTRPHVVPIRGFHVLRKWYEYSKRSFIFKLWREGKVLPTKNTT